jgi:hypothetical protein
MGEWVNGRMGEWELGKKIKEIRTYKRNTDYFKISYRN